VRPAEVPVPQFDAASLPSVWSRMPAALEFGLGSPGATATPCVGPGLGSPSTPAKHGTGRDAPAETEVNGNERPPPIAVLRRR